MHTNHSVRKKTCYNYELINVSFSSHFEFDLFIPQSKGCTLHAVFMHKAIS